MGKPRLLVYGAGGHAKVVIDILELANQYEIIGVVDDDPAKANNSFCGYRIIGGIETFLSKSHKEHIVLALGDNKTRKVLAQRLESAGALFASAVHPAATVARDVSIGEGSVVMANAAINPGSTIGRHVIINTGATVDHDCVIGDFVHISPGVHIGGNVVIESMVHIGIGASVIPGIQVGKGSIIGAGSAVVTDISPGVVAVGIPAKAIKTAT